MGIKRAKLEQPNAYITNLEGKAFYVPDPSENREFAEGKIASTKIPRIELIPTEAINRLASVCELGLARKGDKAWNALTNNQEILGNKELMFDRIGHVIEHAMVLRDKLMRDDFTIDEDDDVAAIIWGGMFLCCATRREHELSGMAEKAREICESRSETRKESF